MREADGVEADGVEADDDDDDDRLCLTVTEDRGLVAGLVLSVRWEIYNF